MGLPWGSAADDLVWLPCLVLREPHALGIQGFGNLGASAIADIIWTAASPSAAFAYLAAWMLVAVAAISTAMRPH